MISHVFCECNAACQRLFCTVDCTFSQQKSRTIHVTDYSYSMQFRLLKKAIKVGLALWYLAGWAVTWLRVVPSQLTRKRA